MSEISTATLQDYADRRAADKARSGRPIRTVTVRKELATLRAVWNWAFKRRLVNHAFPALKEITFAKEEEKPRFRVFSEVERLIARGGLSEAEEKQFWESVFLSKSDLVELLEYVRTNGRHPFIYPLIVFAAHTGARRSEIARSRIDDVDLDRSLVIISERKRVRGRITTREVPLTPHLRDTLKEWFAVHPGGQFTFTSTIKHKKETAPLGSFSFHELHSHFKVALKDSKWKHLRGWHVFRHSFCSTCAATGLDQRLINAWVGHQTEEMVRRYRHLFPDQSQQAIRQVFDQPLPSKVEPSTTA